MAADTVTVTAQADGTFDRVMLGTANTITRDTASAPDHGFAKAANGQIIAWTRWAGGTVGETLNGPEPLTAGQGDYVIAGSPVSKLPTTGLITYNLLSYLAPTFVDGSANPGSFSGSMTLNFATRRVGLDFLIGLAGSTYELKVGGDPANPTDSSSGFSIAGQINATGTVTGSPCPSGCFGNAYGSLFGTGATQAGVTYQIGGGAKQIIGGAIFGTGAQTVTSTPTLPGPTLPHSVTPTTPGGTGGATLAATSGLVVTYAGTASVASNVANVTGSRTLGGASGAVVDNNGALQSFGTHSLGTTINTDVWANTVMSIGRWTDGTSVGPASNERFQPNAREGLAYLVTAPFTGILPVSGSANYTLVSATKPNFVDGLSDPGTLTNALLRIDFGSKPVFDFSGTVTMPETGGSKIYTITTSTLSGGALNSSISNTGVLTGQISVTGSTGSSACAGRTGGTSCLGDVSGYLAGGDVSRAGLVYTFGVTGGITGAALFQSTTAAALPTTVAAGTTSGDPSKSGFVNPAGQVNNGLVNIVATGPYGANGGVPFTYYQTQANVLLDAAGAIKTFGLQKTGTVNDPAATFDPTSSYYRVTATTADAQSGSGWQIGRWNGGEVDAPNGRLLYTPAQGFLYAAVRPVPATTVTVAGSATYTLSGATAPIASDARTLISSSLTGRIGILFATAPKLGLDLHLSANFGLGNYTGDFVSSGGIASPSLSMNSSDGGFGTVFASGQINSTGGTNCVPASLCRISYTIQTGDTRGALAALTYEATGIFTGSTSLLGAAVFSQDSFTATPPAGSPALPPAAADSRQLAYAGSGVGGDVRSDYLVTADSAGKITNFANRTATTESVSSGTNTVDGGIATSATDTIAWSRWSGGTASGTFLGSSKMFAARSANQGFHIVSGAPATNMPTSGTAQYTLAGATAPTVEDGSSAPGTFTGTLGVDFAAKKVGITSTVTVGGAAYAMATTGGAAAPGAGGLSYTTSTTSAAQGTGFSGSVGVTGAGASCGGSCSAFVNGFFSGNGAPFAGIDYLIQGSDATKAIQGVAAFKK
ncbi:hypothetical protein SPAN111604_13690 [Sphingomonas antarctica]